MPFIECPSCGWRIPWAGSYESPNCYNTFCRYYDPTWSVQSLDLKVATTTLTASIKTLAVKWSFTYGEPNPTPEKDTEKENTE